MKDNCIVVDLSKVQWAKFGYRNQHGDFRPVSPVGPTVFNQSFCESERVFMSGNDPLSMIDYAMHNNLLDRWIQEVKFKVTANVTLTYTGEKAVSLYKAFCERQFNKKK